MLIACYTFILLVALVEGLTAADGPPTPPLLPPSRDEIKQIAVKIAVINLPEKITKLPNLSVTLETPKGEPIVGGSSGDNCIKVRNQEWSIPVYPNIEEGTQFNLILTVSRTVDCPYSGSCELKGITCEDLRNLKEPIKLVLTKVTLNTVSIKLVNKATGEPLKGQPVSLVHLLPDSNIETVYKGQSNDQGTVSFDAWNDAKYTAYLEPEGVVPAGLVGDSLNFSGAELSVNWTIEIPGVVVLGTVVDQNGKPLSEFSALLHIVSSDAKRDFGTSEVVHGKFDVRGLEPGKYLIEMIPQSKYPSSEAYCLQVPVPFTIEANLQHPAAMSLAVLKRVPKIVKITLIHEDDNRPLVNIPVQITGSNSSFGAISDDKGLITLQLDDGNYVIRVDAKNLAKTTRTLHVNQDTNSSYAFSTLRNLKIHVSIEKPPPIGMLNMVLYSIEQKREISVAPVDKNDEIQFENIPDGKYLLAGREEGGAVSLKTIEVGPKTTSFSFEFQTSSFMSGKVDSTKIQGDRDLVIVLLDCSVGFAISMVKVNPDTLEFQLPVHPGELEIQLQRGGKSIFSRRITIPKNGPMPFIELP